MSSRHQSLGLRIRRLFLVLCAVIFVALAFPVPEAFADNLREVAERVARQHDAKKVISARVVERGGRKFYVIRILTRDDVIKTIRVPADGNQYLFNSVGAVSDRDRPPGSVVNRRSLPQQGKSALGAVSGRRLTSSVSFRVMPGLDPASSVRCVGPEPTLYLTGLPVKPAMTQEPPASANRT